MLPAAFYQWVDFGANEATIFWKARIAAERVPEQHELEHAVARNRGCGVGVESRR
jgi:hypothetical protein